MGHFASAMTLMPGNQTGGKMMSSNMTNSTMKGNLTSGMMKGNETGSTMKGKLTTTPSMTFNLVVKICCLNSHQFFSILENMAHCVHVEIYLCFRSYFLVLCTVTSTSCIVFDSNDGIFLKNKNRNILFLKIIGKYVTN